VNAIPNAVAAGSLDGSKKRAPNFLDQRAGKDIEGPQVSHTHATAASVNG
jgi:hypothetical protein